MPLLFQFSHQLIIMKSCMKISLIWLNQNETNILFKVFPIYIDSEMANLKFRNSVLFSTFIGRSSKQTIIQMERPPGFLCKKYTIIFLTLLSIIIALSSFVTVVVSDDELAKKVHEQHPEIPVEYAKVNVDELIKFCWLIFSSNWSYSEHWLLSHR